MTSGSPLKREIRVALCKRCNFDCFFCHAEGLDRRGAEPLRPVGDYFNLIRRTVALGYTDVTLTGGEPLIRGNDVEWLLEKLGETDSTPDITVVTNACFVTDSLIESAKAYPGNLKFNVSLHSVEPAVFRRIVRARTDVGQIIDNISRMVNAGIRVKLNMVVLNGVNSGHDVMRSYLERAGKMGVSGIKFIELLVTRDNRMHYRYFYSDEAIRRDLENLGFVEMSTNMRASTFASAGYPDMNVEITRCACKLGCIYCLDYRQRQFDSSLQYHPCFAQSTKGICIGNNVDDLQGALRKGDKSIAAFARLYGAESQMIVPREIFVDSRAEVFYETGITANDVESILVAHGYTPAKQRSFHLYFCLPREADPECAAYRKIIKYGYDLHTPNRFEIIMTREEHVQKQNALVTKRWYLTAKPEEIPGQTEKEAAAYMEAIGYLPWFNRRLEIVDYSRSPSGQVVSIDRAASPLNIKISATSLDDASVQNVLRQIGAKPIRIPFTQWLAGQGG